MLTVRWDAGRKLTRRAPAGPPSHARPTDGPDKAKKPPPALRVGVRTRLAGTLVLSRGGQLSGAMSTYPIYEEAVFFTTATVAWMTVAYGDYAERRGWRAGRWFHGGHPLLLVPAAVSAIFAIVGSLLIVPWWSIFITLIGSFFAALLLVNILKVYTQPVCIVGVYLAWLWSGILVTRYFL